MNKPCRVSAGTIGIEFERDTLVIEAAGHRNLIGFARGPELLDVGAG